MRQQIHSQQDQQPSLQSGDPGSSKPKIDGSRNTVGKLIFLVLLLVVFWGMEHDSHSGVAAVSSVAFIVLMTVFGLELNKRNKYGANEAQVSRVTARFTDSSSQDLFELHSSAEDDLPQNAQAAVRNLEDTADATREKVRPEDTWPLVNPATGNAMVPGTMVDVGGSAFGSDLWKDNHQDMGVGTGMPRSDPWDH